MQEIFSYDSKVMQIIMKIADLAILNILYVLCCIPLFTIGAAQAGLYSGIRQLMNKEDDRSPIVFFFRGFANGFRKITGVHCLFLVGIAILVFNLVAVLFWSYSGIHAPIWMCVAALIILALFHTMLGMFHANFDCTFIQLFRNIFFVTMAYFPKAVLCAVLVWIPFVVAMVDLYSFLGMFPIWFCLYYAVAYLFCYSMMKKPFESLKTDFLAAQKAAQEQPEALPEAQTESLPEEQPESAATE